MKIAIESQRIFRAGKHGMDVVALETIRQIQRLDSRNEYLLFAKAGPDRDCIPSARNFHTHVLKALSYLDWEQIILPAAIRRFKPDILHCTANTAPLQCPVPLVLTLHDIIFLENGSVGGSAYQKAGNLYRRIVVPPAIKKAAVIITVSEYERSVIVQRGNVDPDKVRVIHNGVHQRFHSEYAAGLLQEFRKRYRLPEQFILLLGNTAPKKNTAGMLRAYVQYCELATHPLPLVVTDYERNYVMDALQRMRKEYLIESIQCIGYVPTADMPLLYNCSSVFVYPSLRESFGLPVLEAMGCGVPVITSDRAALPEVAGNAAILSDPQRPDKLAADLHQLLSDYPMQQVLIKRGKERIRQFSWQAAAEKTIAIYESLQ